MDPLIVAYNDSGDDLLLVRAEALARDLLAADPSRVDVLAALSTVLMLRGRTCGPEVPRRRGGHRREGSDADRGR